MWFLSVRIVRVSGRRFVIRVLRCGSCKGGRFKREK